MDIIFNIISYIISNIWIFISGIFITLLQDPILKFIKRYLKKPSFNQPTGSKEVLIFCDIKDLEDAKNIYIAGDFNSWLNAEHGEISISVWDKKYRLNKNTREGKTVWSKKVWVFPGIYNFKFVCNGNHWISWKRNKYFLRGDKSPSGYNYKLVVKK